MLTLLLAAAACASPDMKCEDYGGSTPYDVPNAISLEVGFTPAGDGVVAACVSKPGSANTGYVHILDAYTGVARQVTTAGCAADELGDGSLMMNSQFVVLDMFSSPVPREREFLTFVPLNGSAPFKQKTDTVYAAASNGDSLTVVVVRGFFAPRETPYALEVRDSHGALQKNRYVLDAVPRIVAVSKRSSSAPPSSPSDYYTAVYYSFPSHSFVAVYDSNSELVAKHTLPEFTIVNGMKFRDEDNSLVVAATDEALVYNIKTGEKTTFPHPSSTNSVAFNADGSKMAMVLARHVYIRDLYTGDGRTLCTVDGYTGVSLAMDGQGRSVVLTYSKQYDNPAPPRVSVLNVPDVTNVPATPTPPTNAPSDSSAPIGAIIGGVLGGVALLVAAGVGFCLWKKRQAVPEETYVDMPSVEPTVN